MHHFTDTAQTTEAARVAAEAELALNSSEVGEQLCAAQAADREQRGLLVRRLHRQLGVLRQSDLLIQRCGAGVSVGMVLAAGVLLFRGASAEQVMQPMMGALVSSVGSLGLISGLAWIHDRTRKWMIGTGLAAEWAPAAEAAEPPQETHGEPWFCTACRIRNPSDAATCSGCAHEKPVEPSRLQTRVREVESATGNVMGMVAWIALAGAGLLLLISLLVLVGLALGG